MAVSVGVTALCLSAAPVAAEEEKKSIDEQVQELMAKIVDVNAMVATTYTYSFNKPTSDFLPYLIINKDDNTLALYDAFLQISRNREDEDFGFTLNMDFGETARFTGADWDGSGAIGDSGEEDNFFELREAYGTYKVPWGGIKVKAGKFVTLLGYEVLMTNTAYNPNVTHSYMFGQIPFTHVGVLANAPLGEMAWVDVGVVNGWDNAVDNNNSPSLLAGLGFKPLDVLGFYLAGIYGPELCGQDSTKCTGLPPAGAGSKRGAVTLNATFTAPEETGLALAIDSLYANESDALPDGDVPFAESASWYGLAGYVMWAPPFEEVEGLTLNLRAEVICDPDGYRNPNGSPGVGPQTIFEITPTIGYAFAEHFLARLEYRYDHSNKQAYQTEDTFRSFDNTLTAEFIVAF
jgi:opacity protein-like surface antigen